MKVAVLADLHLPGRCDTVKEAIFNWSIDEAVSRKCDLIIGAGDLTSIGEFSAADRIMRKLESGVLPFILTPGNAELRLPEEAGEVLRRMQTPIEYADTVFLLDSSRARLDGKSSEFLSTLAGSGKHGVLLVSHCPPDHWEEVDQENLQKAFDAGVVSMLVYGHKHIDISLAQQECIRGLDPDKAAGGAPALVFFTSDASGVWHREDVVCPFADAAAFPEEDKQRFWSSIGISGMKTPLENLALAAEKRLSVFELRFSGVENLLNPEISAALQRWRNCGGKYLSLHLPDLKYSRSDGFSGMEALRAASETAVALGCSGVTLHVPRCFADELSAPEEIDAAAAVAASACAPLFEHNIRIGVENLHTSAAEREAERYKFGCTIAECMSFINALRRLHPEHTIGLHLDIGHARNNRPFCNRETLSDWYAIAGKEVVAMHIHQVSRKDGELKNHTGFSGVYTQMISLCSLAMARRCGQIGEVPMILELRCPPEETLEVLKRGFGCDSF